MKRKSVSLEDRARIAEKNDTNKTVKEIVDDIVLNYITVYKIAKKFLRTRSIELVKRGGDRRSKLKSDHKAVICSWVDINPFFTFIILKDQAQNNIGLGVTRSTIDRCLRQFNYSVKSITAVPGIGTVQEPYI